jgi:hypothetical protein
MGVASAYEIRNAYTVLVRKPEGKETIWKSVG